MKGLKGRNVLVTGGATGLGKAIAQRLAHEGATIIISDVQGDLGQRTAQECHFDFLQHDVRSEASWDDVVRQIEVSHGALHVLINNAGIIGPTDASTPESTQLSDWRKIFAVNVEGVFLGCRAAIAAMRCGGGGAIVNVASVTSMLATPGSTAYGASKAAVRQLTRSVAQYCMQENLRIRCNCVHPGTIRTALWDKHAEEHARMRGMSFEEVVAEVSAKTPMGNLGSPEDIAAMVAFLASDEAGHVTGAEFVVDGGFVGCDTYLHSAGMQSLKRSK